MARWTFAAASVRGTSHVKAGTRLQDAQSSFECEGPGGNSVFSIVVSDGAGSASFGGQGASLVCRVLSQNARRHFERSQQVPDDATIWDWIDEVRDRILVAADRRLLDSRDFAATLIFAVAGCGQLKICHIGDGAVVARDAVSHEWRTLSAPENGEYASTTYFVTDSPAPRLRISAYEDRYDALAVFTDGIEGLVLNSQTACPHPAFFQPMIAPLERGEIVGRDAALSSQLSRFLDSDRVNDRTDDDKTLVLAHRR
ncbi:PP2C family serine/threonine-protein phosphatase [Sinorhizobium kummerowiae]|uniref:Protein phosphatase 2C domain-containing protein n=1 Tax=Sinorhizobium kummerowiae TaxID=158892 RepID=A0ABY8TD67_9HYPH|nr:PP2C family serine/threonine-protein phosphatase [Sinorhizobium kummerowiae]WHS94240.1 protein phosphatase 2C domain-containing protein [Sinorhizobium kummerowiae]WRW46170.1 PP2C family serine/threonine-protein phosphatase [Sinorhizobium kummerowiae]